MRPHDFQQPGGEHEVVAEFSGADAVDAERVRCFDAATGPGRGNPDMPVVLYGPAYSTYARTARLALEGRRHRL